MSEKAEFHEAEITPVKPNYIVLETSKFSLMLRNDNAKENWLKLRKMADVYFETEKHE